MALEFERLDGLFGLSVYLFVAIPSSYVFLYEPQTSKSSNDYLTQKYDRGIVPLDEAPMRF